MKHHTRFVNPIEVSFARWIHGSPESSHNQDIARFNTFVANVLRYKKTKGKKWLTESHFTKQCKKYSKLSDQSIEKYFHRMDSIKDYYDCQFSLPGKWLVTGEFDGQHEYYVQMAIDGRIETIKVDEEIYKKSYFGEREFIKTLRQKGE